MAKIEQKNRKILKTATWIISFGAAYYFSNQYFDNSKADEIQNAISEGNLEAEQVLSVDLPKRLDYLTTLSSVSADGVRFYYHHSLDQIDYSDAEWAQTFEWLRVGLTQNVCASPAMVSTMDLGGIYIYDYKSFEGVMLKAIEFKKGDCLHPY